MGKNQSASGLTNIIHYDSNGNITFVSGSTTLMSISSSGAITTTGVISGSNALTASYALNADQLDGLNSTAFATTGAYSDTSGSLYSTSASLSTASGSFNTRVSALEATGSALSSSILSVSSSAYATSGSLSTASGSFNSRVATIESKYATTGSNTFTAPQYVSDTTVPTGFANTTGSIYTDGGVLITKDSYFSGSVYIKGNVTVYGTQSIAYISSSQLNIGTNVITVNTSTPTVRFGGMSVYDSGSTNSTGSIFWDSQNNHWIYARESGSTYGGGMLISGPRRANGTNMGDEQGTTACYLTVGQGGDHITSSMIYHDSSVTCISTPIIGASTACFAGRICSAGLTTNSNININDGSPIVFGGVCGYIYTYSRRGGGSCGTLIFNNGTGQNLWFGEVTSNIYGLGQGAAGTDYSGTPLLNLDLANQRIGIGTIAPLEKIHINGGTGDGATYDAVQIFTRTSSTGNVEAAKIVLDDLDTNWANLVFRVKTTASSGESNAYYTDAVTIKGSNAYVGIGTSSPTTPLSLVGDHVSGLSAFKIQPITAYVSGGLSSLGFMDSDGARKAIIYGSANGLQLETSVSTPILFNIFGAEKMRVNSNGNVGIGTSTVNNKLQIGSTSYSENEFAIGNGTVNFAIDLTASNTDIYSSGAFTFNTALTERMRITNAGSVYIGDWCNRGGRLLTSNCNYWYSDGVTPCAVITSNTSATCRGNAIGLALHNDGTSQNSWAPTIAFSRRSWSTNYNSTMAAITAQATGCGNDSNWVAGDLTFAVTPVGGYMSESMRISGNSIVGYSQWYTTYTKNVCTPSGGYQTVRFIEDALGQWVLVGRFATNAAVTIQSTWGSVRGLSTSLAQDEPTAFSADWGATCPTEVRIMGATDFSKWRETRTVDFIYKNIPNRPWCVFFNGGNTDGTYQTTGTIRYGWNTCGAYDGFGRWSNPYNCMIGMSDAAYTNPSSAYTTPTAGAFNWNTAQDAKITAIHYNSDYSGQDVNSTIGFGIDDNIRGFYDAYPNLSNNMSSGDMYSSAVWILLKFS